MTTEVKGFNKIYNNCFLVVEQNLILFLTFCCLHGGRTLEV